MADGFGSLGSAYSILGQATGAEFKRKRKEEEDYYRTLRRQQRQSQIFNLLASPLLEGAGKALSDTVSNVFSRPFEEKYNDFADNSQIRNLKRMQKNAMQRVSVVDQLDEKILGSDKTQNKWFQDDSYPAALAKATEDVISAGKDPELYKAAIKAEARKTSDKVGLTRSKAFTFAKKERDDLGTMEDFEKLVTFNNRRPENLAEAALGFGKRIFTGKTSREIDEQSFKAIADSNLVEESSQFNEAFRLFKQGASFEDVAPMIEASMTKDKGLGFTRTDSDFTVGGEDDETIIVTTTKTETDNYNRVVSTDKKITNITYLNTNEDGSKVVNKAAVLKGLNTTNNLFNQAEKILTPQALNAYSERLSKLENKDGTSAKIILTALKSPEEYMVAAEILQDFMVGNNIKDTLRDQTYIEVLKTFSTETIPFIITAQRTANDFLKEGNKEGAEEQMRIAFDAMINISALMNESYKFGQGSTPVRDASSLFGGSGT